MYRDYRLSRELPHLSQLLPVSMIWKFEHLQGDDREVNVDVFLHPSKYLKRLPLQEIVADTRIYRNGVERYK